MDIHASPIHLAHVSATPSQRLQELQQQREHLAQEQKHKAQQQAEALQTSRSEGRQRDQLRVYQAHHSANVAQKVLSPNIPSPTTARDDDALELKPLVITERTHPAVKSFLRVAELENDFHIIDTYV